MADEEQGGVLAFQRPYADIYRETAREVGQHIAEGLLDPLFSSIF